MDLQQFISQTLVQIVSGVKDAQKETNDTGAKINPSIHSSEASMAKHGILSSSMHEVAHIVEFDVALTVVEGTGTKGGIGVFAGAVTLGSSGQSKAENTSVSRVKFSVPVSLPKLP